VPKGKYFLDKKYWVNLPLMVTRTSHNKDEHGNVRMNMRRQGHFVWWVVPYGAFERLCGLRGKKRS